MLLLALSIYLLLGVIVSNASSTLGSYLVALTAWPALIFFLALRTRFELTATQPVRQRLSPDAG